MVYIPYFWRVFYNFERIALAPFPQGQGREPQAHPSRPAHGRQARHRLPQRLEAADRQDLGRRVILDHGLVALGGSDVLGPDADADKTGGAALQPRHSRHHAKRQGRAP